MQPLSRRAAPLCAWLSATVTDTAIRAHRPFWQRLIILWPNDFFVREAGRFTPRKNAVTLPAIPSMGEPNTLALFMGPGSLLSSGAPPDRATSPSVKYR
jgi:hypothetical protein